MAHLAHYKEAHPLPFVWTHWINLVCMVLLIFTGFMIHFPYIPAIMGICRGVHIFCGFVLVVNCLVRIILAFFIPSAPTLGTRVTVKDYKVWLPQKDNRHQLWPWIKYYFFFKREHPLSAKYGVPQKLAYWFIPFLILFMFYTGLCLWSETSWWGICSWFTNVVGGAMTMRILHWFGMFVFIWFLMIHVYLVFMEGIPTIKLMFMHRETPGEEYDPFKHNVVSPDTARR